MFYDCVRFVLSNNPVNRVTVENNKIPNRSILKLLILQFNRLKLVGLLDTSEDTL